MQSFSPSSPSQPATPGTDVWDYATGPSAWGTLLVACSGPGICALMLGDSPEPLVAELRRGCRDLALHGGTAAAPAALAQVLAWQAHPERTPQPPLDLRGTAFQLRVWQALRAIPPGVTRTYGQLARTLGCAGAARAVGAACGANPVALLVPCHRAVASDGSLRGFRWGLARKRALLEHERRLYPAAAACLLA